MSRGNFFGEFKGAKSRVIALKQAFRTAIPNKKL
jgi:hypothetical protein